MMHSADIKRINAEIERMAVRESQRISQVAEEMSDECDAIDALADESGIDIDPFDCQNLAI